MRNRRERRRVQRPEAPQRAAGGQSTATESAARRATSRAAQSGQQEQAAPLLRNRGSAAAVATVLLHNGQTSTTETPTSTETGGLQSPRFQAVPLMAAVLAGEQLLRRGTCDGVATLALQAALLAVGNDPGPIDGLWGPRTSAAVRAFQSSEGLATDGIVGPLTITALDRADAAGGGGGPGAGTADPNLRHQTGGTENAPTDPERERAARQGRLPYVGPLGEGPLPYIGRLGHVEGWSGAAILRRWTQLDLDPTTATDAHRCVANAAMAPRILAGPGATASFAEAIARDGRTQARVTTDPVLKATLAAKAEVCGIQADQIRLGFGTYHSLDLIADAVKHIKTVDPTGATTADAAHRIHGTNATQRQPNQRNLVPSDEAAVDRLCDMLRPGEAWLVLVDVDVPGSAPGTDPEAQLDHYVTVGRRFVSSRPNGRVYLYDPWPRQGSQVVDRETQSDDFLAYFRYFGPQGRVWKYSEWLSFTEPRA